MSSLRRGRLDVVGAALLGHVDEVRGHAIIFQDLARRLFKVGAQAAFPGRHRERLYATGGKGE